MMGGYSFGQSMIDPAAIPPPGMKSQSRAGVTVSTHTVLTLDVVQTALRILTAGVIKRGNLRAYTNETTDSGQVFRQWSPQQPPLLTNTFAFQGPITNQQSRGRAQTVTSMALFGEAWWYVLTRSNQTGSPTAIEVLHPALLDVRKQPGNPEVQFVYGAGSGRATLDVANLVHIPLDSLPNSNRGLSSIDYAAVSYGLALAAMQFGEYWFAQGAAPSYLLSTTDDLTEDVAQRIAQRFRVDHSGLMNAHLPLVAGPNLKVEKLGSTPDESQFLGTLEYVRTCIASMFGIPAHLIGGANDKGNVWGANYEEVSQQMEDFTFAPYTVPMEEIHSNLLPGGLMAAFPTTLVQPNALNLGNALQFMRQAQVITPNEARAVYLGLPPLPDGDDLIVPLASNTAPEQTGDTPSQSTPQPPAGMNPEPNGS
jgi:HK97 family phage portal protein